MKFKVQEKNKITKDKLLSASEREIVILKDLSQFISSGETVWNYFRERVPYWASPRIYFTFRVK